MYRKITNLNKQEFSKEDVVIKGYDFRDVSQCWVFISSYIEYTKFMENRSILEYELLRSVLLRLQWISKEGKRRKGESTNEYLIRLGTSEQTSLQMRNDFVCVGDWEESMGTGKVFPSKEIPGLLDRLCVQVSMQLGTMYDVFEDLEYAFWEYLECLCCIIKHLSEKRNLDDGFLDRITAHLKIIDTQLIYYIEDTCSENLVKVKPDILSDTFSLFLLK